MVVGNGWAESRAGREKMSHQIDDFTVEAVATGKPDERKVRCSSGPIE